MPCTRKQSSFFNTSHPDRHPKGEINCSRIFNTPLKFKTNGPDFHRFAVGIEGARNSSHKFQFSFDPMSRKGCIDSSSAAHKRNSFGAIMKDITDTTSATDRVISMSFLTRQRRYEKRRIYDLLNVLCAVGICKKVGTNNYLWMGLDNITDSVKAMGLELELKAHFGYDITVIQLPEAAHLGIVVKHFIWTFLFFGNNTVNIHRMANIMSSENVASKKVLRRLYLVTHVLEHTNIVRHAKMIGEYEVSFDVNEIMLAVFKDLRDKRGFPPESILAQLNEISRDYLDALHRERVRACPIGKSPVYPGYSAPIVEPCASDEAEIAV